MAYGSGAEGVLIVLFVFLILFTVLLSLVYYVAKKLRNYLLNFYLDRKVPNTIAIIFFLFILIVSIITTSYTSLGRVYFGHCGVKAPNGSGCGVTIGDDRTYICETSCSEMTDQECDEANLSCTRYQDGSCRASIRITCPNKNDILTLLSCSKHHENQFFACSHRPGMLTFWTSWF